MKFLYFYVYNETLIYMDKQKAPVFTFSIVAIILGVALYKQFDFETYRFEKTGLAIVHGCIYSVRLFYHKGLKKHNQQ